MESKAWNGLSMQRSYRGLLLALAGMLICAAIAVGQDGDKPAEPAQTSAPESAALNPAKRTYSFRGFDYSLRDEPRRVPPRTLEKSSPAPEDAVVLGWPIRWWPSHWSSDGNTASAALTMHQGHPRMTVLEAGKRKVWVKYLDMSIDPAKYPILVMTYRAQRTDTQSGRYALYIDDGSGPDYGGLQAVRQSDIVADGEVHTLSADLRLLNPIGDLIGLALGVQAEKTLEGPAWFELIDLRFESVEPQTVAAPTHEAQVNVVNQAGQPIAGAKVTLNAERRNWSQSVTTDGQGTATLPIVATSAGHCMLRVEAQGHLPVEVRELSREGGSVVIPLEPAAVYRGLIVTDEGEPLPNAAVRIEAGSNWVDQSKGLWTRRDAEAVTDANGRWESPPLPLNAPLVGLHLAHPAYNTPWTSSSHVQAGPTLASGESVLPIVIPTVQKKLEVQDESGAVLQQKVTYVVNQQRWKSSDSGSLSLTLLGTGSQVLLLSEGYAPRVLVLSQTDIADPRVQVVQLERGQAARLCMTDSQGVPLADAQVSLLQWQGMQLRSGLPWGRTDDNGCLLFNVTGDTDVLLIIRKAGVVDNAFISSRLGESPQTVIIPPVAPAVMPSGDDGRRPGYEPRRIFRRISQNTSAVSANCAAS